MNKHALISLLWRTAQASLRDTQAREQAGVGTRFDVLQSQVNLANAQQTLTNSVHSKKSLVVS